MEYLITLLILTNVFMEVISLAVFKKKKPRCGMCLFGLIGPMMGLMGSAMTNSSNQAIAGMQTAAQKDIANKNRASENMRQGETLLNKSNTDLLDTQYRTTNSKTSVFQDLVGTMRDAFLRSPYIK